MILSDTRILEEIKRCPIVIRPFHRKYLGSNSYDVHLGGWLARYKEEILDCKKHNKVQYFRIPRDGMLLVPSMLYLGVTKECQIEYRLSLQTRIHSKEMSHEIRR
jgi:dCTP deaminase